MVPWAQLLVVLILCINDVFAVALRPRLSPAGGELQDEIEAYLRALTQLQPIFTGSFQSTANNMNSRLAIASPDKDHNQPPEYPVGNQPWLVNSGIENSYAFSSILPNKFVKNQEPVFDDNAVAYASVRDVESEEFLDKTENVISSSKDPEKKAELVHPYSLTVADALARKSDDLSTLQQNTRPIKADSFSDVYFVAIVAGCSAAGIFGVISMGFCFYKLQKTSKASAEVDYPAYGVTGPSKDAVSPSGDRKLAQSAQMYHYQHQKQQMIAVEKAGSTKNTSASDVDSEEENEEGDYTVYECPGLAPTGEMEVKNPLFIDSTPMSPPVLSAKSENIQNK